MKIICEKCNELLIEADSINRIAVKCWKCGKEVSNMMHESWIEEDSCGNVVAPKLATYYQRK